MIVSLCRDVSCPHSPIALPGGRFLATTQFEASAARAAFPCFDEPQLKAVFQLAMVRHERHTALFNTPRRNTEDLGFYLGAGIVSGNGFFPERRAARALISLISLTLCS